MLHVHRSASADVLVAELGRLLAAPTGDPFAAEVVAVPAKGVERWLAQRLSHVLGAGAQGDGICANVEFASPTRLLDDALRAAQPDPPDVDPWTPERSTWPLLRLLDAGAAGPALRDQLRTGDRRYAGAARLARLFGAYGQERPAMLRAWATGANTDDRESPLPADLIWQAELWRALRAEIGTPSPAERLPGALARIGADPGLLGLPERITVFGLNRLSFTRLELLAAIARGREVHLFVQHASPALWDSVAAGGSATLPMLASMSRDVRALQRRLASAVPGHESTLHAHPERPPTLLGALQDALAADRIPDVLRELAPDDRSVAVHACHGRARQVEVLREVVLDRLAADPTLEPRDVLVMCPDVEEFAPLVAAAFGLSAGTAAVDLREQHPAARLRVRLADRALTQGNPLLGTMATLLELSHGRLTAADVLDLAASAPVRRRFGFDDDAIERMHAWVGSARISWGLDAEHRERYKLGAIDQGTWRDGLDRVLLGVAMEEDAHLLGSTLPLDDVDSADIDLAGRLAEFVDRLDVAVRALCCTQSLQDWADALLAATLSIGAPATGQAWQAAAVATELAEITESAAGPDAGLELTPADIGALLAGRLAGRPSRAGFRTGTLTVSTMVPMRSVPHRVIVLLGLDEETFPRSGVPDGDDLLARPPRRAGERDPRAEDRQLLLDAVCAAGEHLVLLYCGADERTGALVPPAVPVGELLDTLDTVALAPGGGSVRNFVTTRHPLQPFDPRNFGINAAGEPGPPPVSFDAAALAGARALLRPRVDPRPLVAGPLDPVPAADVELADLIDFLFHPVRAFLRQRLDVQARGWHTEPTVAVPIELDGLQQWGIGDRVLAAHLRGVPIEDCLALEARRGALPPNALGARVGGQIAARAEAIAAAARADLVGGGDVAVDINVLLPGGRRLTGTVTGIRGETRVRVSYSSLNAKHRLGAWVDLLTLCATDPDADWCSVTITRSKDRGARHHFRRIDAKAALDALAELVAVRDEGLREPLPMPVKTTCAYAEVRRRGAGDHLVRAALDAADKEWAGKSFGGEKAQGERDDAEHRLVHGSDAPLDRLDLARLDDLARRVWLPLLTAEAEARS
ncbi:MAG TPA: exodeoxyribonuclease V subunit gamma [Sporichthya sp.]|nr:exodeoxyribonuclease V subunit gamma [Sporichthya sp.]